MTQPPLTAGAEGADPKGVDAPAPLAVLERKLEGHTSWVWSMAVSPDGTWAASGSWDKTVKIWDLETGECRATLEGHEGKVRSVAITLHGEYILSGSDDKTICIWDAQGRRQLAKWDEHTGAVPAVAVLPGGQQALSCSDDYTLKLWDISSGRCLRTLEGHTSPVWDVSVSSDGQRAISGYIDNMVKHWDLETGQCLATLTGHAGIVYSVQITPDGWQAVSGSDDKTVKLWDLETGRCVGTFEGHGSQVRSVAISPDGALVASTGYQDTTVRLWDLQSGACLQVIENQDRASPISVAFSPDGSRLVVGTGEAATIYIYCLTGVQPAPAGVAATPTARYTNAKVVLVGESGVGKSGLAHRLVEDEFVPTPSTHGMGVWRLDLPLAPRAGLEREALLWDLAGQEDYRLVHQLFLEETALALVLFNPQKDDPFAEVGDWLKALCAAVREREVARLLIAARTDVGAVKVSGQKIERALAEYGFAGYLDTSAKTGHNCSDKIALQQAGLPRPAFGGVGAASAEESQPSALKCLIAENIPWETLPWTSTPELLRELKNAVLEIAEAEEVRLLRFPELLARLRAALPERAFGEADARTAVTLLANHGLVKPLAFGDLVLLRPELVNGYASAVIRAARTHVDEIGCVREHDVFDKRIDFEGVERLPSADEDLLLRAMVQTFLDRSLCIAEDTPDGRQLIFPSQYRRERSIPGHPEVFLSYTFSGELATVYTTLVVRLWYSRIFDTRELWRNAAEFATSKNQVAGLVMAKSGEGEGTIQVFFETQVPDELKVVFIEYVHRHLHRYARDVRRDRRYVCPACGTPVRDLAVVRRRLEAGRTFIYCQFCDDRVPLIDHIEQRLASDPVARAVKRMDQRAEQALDTQALEQILIGHMLAICGEANQIFRPTSMADYGIDGEVEFRDRDGKASGRKVYVQLKSGDSHLRERKRDETLVFDVKNPRHLTYWVEQPCDVYLVIRDGEGLIRWMNVSAYLRARPDKASRQIVFAGEKLDAEAVRRVRDACI